MAVDTTFTSLLFIYLGISAFEFVSATSAPEVTAMIPTYGPVAGRTKMVLIGQNLSHLTKISFKNDTEDITFHIGFVNDTFIYCTTPNVSKSLSGTSGPLVLVFNKSGSVYNYRTTESFTYKPDPVIFNVTPGSGIVRGGVDQIITGQHLDSVKLPLMVMYLVYNKKTVYEQKDHRGQKYDGVCHVVNSTCMICKSKPVSTFPESSIPTWNPLRRPEYNFWIGFIMDGVVYRNFSEFIIWQDPTFNNFDDNLLPFKVYDGQTEIKIRGTNFNLGVRKEDYAIIVGNGTTPSGNDSTCEITYFITNVIRCKPPTDRPYHGGIHKNGEPQVVVMVGYMKQHLGYLQYQLTAWDNPVIQKATIGVSCGMVILLIVVVATLICVKKQQRREEAVEGQRNYYIRSPDLWTRLSPQMKAELEPLLKNYDRLRIGRELGEGQFGSVYSAKFQHDDGSTIFVAAKTIKDTTVTSRQLQEFLQEATMMRHFNHPNVLSVVGVVFKEGRPFVLIPFMENGDLRQYLRNQNNKMNLANLLTFALDAAKGMSHISKKNFVHRDLAARNCMVDERRGIKIADFGLARDIHQDDYYRIADRSRPMPIKWMAIESLDDGKFTTYSDVWSYGVLLWELMTRGKTPYADIDSFKMKQYLLRGRRLDVPTITPDLVAELMTACWKCSPKDRPTFDHIASNLETFLEEDRLANQQSSFGYLKLRGIDQNADGHNYQNLVVESSFDASDDPRTSAFSVSAARAAFDSIPDPDGYLRPLAGDAATNGHPGGNPDYYNQCNNDHGHDNPGFDGFPERESRPPDGYLVMHGGLSKDHKQRRGHGPLTTEEIKLKSMN